MAGLLHRLRGGDGVAFDEIYALYGDRLFGFLTRLCGRRDLAQDLHQETWIKLARAASSLAPETSLAPWLYTVARNTWKDHARGRAREAARLDYLATEPAPAATDADRAIDDGRRVRALEAALQAISEPSREILLLCAVEGLQPVEAATVLGLKPEAARQRLSRARAELSDELDRRTQTQARGAS